MAEGLLRSMEKDSLFVPQRPGIVSSLVFVLEKQGKMAESLDLLRSYAMQSVLRRLTQPNDKDLIIALTSLELKHKTGTPVQTLERLVKQDPSDLRVLSYLILAISETDPIRAQEYAQHLQVNRRTISTELLKTLPSTKVETVKIKKRRKKVKKLPKNYNPNAKPDPGTCN
jgi:SRP72 RNA-binding domain